MPGLRWRARLCWRATDDGAARVGAAPGRWGVSARALTLTTALCALCATATARGAEPARGAEATPVAIVGWRGAGDGCYPRANPPARWSPTENILWKTPLPASSYASPIVVGDRVFVTVEPHEIWCVRAGDGAVEWKQTHGPAEALGAERAAAALAKWNALKEDKRQAERALSDLRKTRPDDKAGQDQLRERITALEKQLQAERRAAPVPVQGGAGNTAATPVSDGRRVFAVFGSGVVGCAAVDGARRWTRFVEGSSLDFGHASSPVLVDGLLLVHFHDLVALDAATGEERWRVALPARHATGVLARAGSATVLVSPGGAVVRARDGLVLVKDDAVRLAEGSAIVDDGLVVALGGDAVALRLPDLLDNQPKIERLWKANMAGGRRIPSPAAAGGLLYGLTSDGILDVADLKAGKPVFRQRLEMGEFYSSVTLAGDQVYLTNTKGETLVLAAGRAFRETARNKLESIGSNLVFEGDRMYARCHKALYCVGPADAARANQ